MPESWKVISSTQLGSYRIFNLREDRARSPRTNEVYGFYVLESPDWVNVIPLTTDNQVVMVRQYRHGTREVTLEFPGGLVEPGDSPEMAARRELLEETGYSSQEVGLLGVLCPHPALFNNRCHTFVARNVQVVGEPRLDQAEDIEVVLVPLADVPGLIAAGEITHSLVLCAFYLFLARECGFEARSQDLLRTSTA